MTTEPWATRPPPSWTSACMPPRPWSQSWSVKPPSNATSIRPRAAASVDRVERRGVREHGSPSRRLPVRPRRGLLDLGAQRQQQLLLGRAGREHDADRQGRALGGLGPVQRQRRGRHAR